MTIRKRISELEKKEINKIVNLTVYWCKDFLGQNFRRKNVLKISVRKQLSGQPVYGFFCPFENVIVIHYNHCTNVKDLVSTVIHEYTHYLQPVRKYYTKLFKKYDYNNHPMEVEARSNENYYTNICWKHIKTISD